MFVADSECSKRTQEIGTTAWALHVIEISED